MGADEENISRAFCRKRGLDPDTMVNVDGNGTMLPLWQVWTSDAALDAVSEAGKKVGWAEAERVACLDDVDEALREFATDPTGDNGTMIIREVMRALRAIARALEQREGREAVAWMRAQAKALGMENAESEPPIYLARFLAPFIAPPAKGPEGREAVAAGEPSAAAMAQAFIERYESRYTPHTVELVMAEVRARASELDTTPPAKVPDGLRLVPVEPTPEMVNAVAAVKLRRLHEFAAGKDGRGVEHGIREEWAAMLAAAPAPKEGGHG